MRAAAFSFASVKAFEVLSFLRSRQPVRFGSSPGRHQCILSTGAYSPRLSSYSGFLPRIMSPPHKTSPAARASLLPTALSPGFVRRQLPRADDGAMTNLSRRVRRGWRSAAKPTDAFLPKTSAVSFLAALTTKHSFPVAAGSLTADNIKSARPARLRRTSPLRKISNLRR